MIAVDVQLDQSATYAMIDTFERNLLAAEQFAAKEIERVIRYQIFGSVVHRLGARAGDGFPYVYREHLSNFMRMNVPIIVQAEGNGFMSVSFNLDGLGTYSDLELGAHHQALLSIDRDSLPTTRKGGLKYNIHPPKVQLPYTGQELENDPERRQEFWEQVIIGRDFGYTMGLMRGRQEWTIGELTGGDIPTFEEVAAARVMEAWVPMGVAPEYLWLENGFTESEPRIYPVDFSRTLENITYCVAERIYEGALIGLVRLAEAAGGSVGVGRLGRPFERSTGQFVPYRAEIDESTADISSCLGDI